MIEYGQPIFFEESSIEMTMDQARKAFSIIRGECCNFESGNCKMLADDENSRCKQLKTRLVICSWFREAVLPLNKELDAEIFNTCEKEQPKRAVMKRCNNCGRSFKPKSARTKNCPECGVKIRRKQWSQSQRKSRSKSTF